MGFTTGFVHSVSFLPQPFLHTNLPQLGGVTLTYSILYLSLYIHRANRNVQRTLLSQQAALLNSVVEPLPPLPDPPAYEVRRAGLAEELKDRWNREVEKLVRNVEETDWSAKRELYEERIKTVWRKVRASESAQEIEGKAKELEQKVKDAVVGGAETAKEKAKETTEERRLLELK